MNINYIVRIEEENVYLVDANTGQEFKMDDEGQAFRIMELLNKGEEYDCKHLNNKE